MSLIFTDFQTPLTSLGLLEMQWFETKNYEISLSATHRCRRGLWWQQQLAPREGNEDAFRRSTFEVAKHLFSIIVSIASFYPDYWSLFLSTKLV